MTLTVGVRRVYDEPAGEDGVRVLVDRLWPRGMRKDTLDHAAWLPEIAPSTDLRRWYAHEPERFAEFDRRYRAELGAPAGVEALDRLRALAADGPLTLLTSTKDVAISHLTVLAAVLTGTAAVPPGGDG